MLARHKSRVQGKSKDGGLVGYDNDEPLCLARLVGADADNPLAVEPPAMVKNQPFVQGLAPPRRE